jgi:hypothetical protein
VAGDVEVWALAFGLLPNGDHVMGRRRKGARHHVVRRRGRQWWSARAAASFIECGSGSTTRSLVSCASVLGRQCVGRFHKKILELGSAVPDRRRQNEDTIEWWGEWSWLRLSFYTSGGCESDGPWRVVCCVGADSMLQFWLDRGGDMMNHCRKMKQRQ